MKSAQTISWKGIHFKRRAALCALMVAFFLIVMPARAAWADEPTKSDEERAIDIAQELISTIVDQEGYQDLYELQIDDSSNISPGEHIEIAAEIDGELRSTNLDL